MIPGGDHTPRLSFGVPVRNGARFLPRLLDSLQAQEFVDFEVVICDNDSSDETESICRRYAGQDPRIRYHRNDHDIGQIGNFNRVYALSRGEYFRWIGADDWLEPAYAGKCIAVLDAKGEAVGVTTLWQFVDQDDAADFVEYTGPRVDSPRVRERIVRMLWFLQSGRNPLFFDPIYSTLRRSALEKTHMLLVDPWTDRFLACELCLLGPFVHVHEILANRRAEDRVASRLPRYHTALKRLARFPPIHTMYAGLAAIIWRHPLPLHERLVLVLAVARAWVKAELSRRSRRFKKAIRRRLLRLKRSH